MVIAETDRLFIEKITLDDAAFFRRLVNSPTWLKYIGERNIIDDNSARDYIEKLVLSSYKEKGYGPYKIVLKEDQISIGVTGFYKRDYLNHVDIGFAILPDYEGHGYAFEATKAIVDYGIKEFNLSLIYGITTEENTRSQRLLERVGMSKVDVIQPKNSTESLLLFSN